MKAALAVVAAAAVVAGIVVGVWALTWQTAPARGKLAAREQIKSGASRIQAYDHFYDVCAAVQGLDQSLDAQYDELAGSTGDDRERVRANIAGIRAQRARSVAQYNADARKSYTIGQFRASDLPYQLPASREKGTVTSCES